MHEYSIVADLIRHVEEEARRARACGVVRLTVVLGELSGVERDLLATAFEVFRERTICENAKLEIRSVAAEWSCPACGVPIPRGAALRCPRCALPARLTQGEEILLERIEMEVA